MRQTDGQGKALHSAAKPGALIRPVKQQLAAFLCHHHHIAPRPLSFRGAVIRNVAGGLPRLLLFYRRFLFFLRLFLKIFLGSFLLFFFLFHCSA